MAEKQERVFSDDASQHFEQILDNVKNTHESYKKKPEWWYWTQSFKDELDDAFERGLIDERQREALRVGVQKRMKEDKKYYQEVRQNLVKMIGEENYDEWWQVEE